METKEKISIAENHPMWRVFDERFRKLENRLLNQKEVLTFDEASEYTGMSKSFLYKLTSAGKIPHYKPNGKMVYFDRSALESWLKQNPVKTKEEIDTSAASYVSLNSGRK